MIGAVKAAPNTSTWTPASVAGLEFWYRPQDTGTLTGTTPVTAIADQSGNGKTATRDSGNYDSGGSINGHNALTASSPDYRTTVVSNPTACTMFAVVHRVGSPSGVETLFGSTNVSTGGGMQFRLDNGAPRLVKSQVAAIGSTGSTALAGDTDGLIVATFADASHGDSYDVRLNGVSGASGSHGVTLTSGFVTSIGVNFLGDGSESEGHTGVLGECGRYNSVLSGGDLALLEAFLMAYWGL